MKKVLLVFMCVVSLQHLFAQVTTETRQFFSQSLNQNRTVVVHKPDSISAASPCPVLIFLPGWTMAPGEFNMFNSALTSLLNANQVKRMLIVVPDGSGGIYTRTYFANSPVNGKHGDYIVKDLVQWIKQEYPVKLDRRYWILGGFSMGGGGSARLALASPEIFSGFASFCGDIMFERATEIFKYINTTESPNFIYTPPNAAKPYTYVGWGFASAFSPDTTNPYKCQFPLVEGTGQLRDSIFGSCLRTDAFTLARQYFVVNHKPSNSMNMYIRAGSNDSFISLYAMSRDFSDSLKSWGITHNYGAHTFGHDFNSGHASSLLIWVDSLFGQSVHHSTGGVDTAWVRHYGSGLVPTTARANDIVADNMGNVYVTGESGGDYVTIKYNSQGTVVWLRRYNGPGYSYNEAKSIAVDGSGNVYVTGTSSGIGDANCATIKYNSSGDPLWVSIYGKVDWEYPSSLAVDENKNVYVTGYMDYYYPGTLSFTMKYSSSGNMLWDRVGGPGSNNFLALDEKGNVYTTGHSSQFEGMDYVTTKLNSAGEEVWTRSYNGPANSGDRASSLAVDGNGNVYVTGYSWVSKSSSDYATIKYNSAGDTLWVRRYNGHGNSNNYASSLAVDGSGNVYVTGNSQDSDTGYDFATIKYNSNGDTLWTRRYNGSTNHDDWAISLALDGSGNVYVTGSSDSSIVTIRYSTNGNEEWIAKYRYTNGWSSPVGIRVDASGNVFVSGTSTGTDGSVYTTIKYSQTPNAINDYVSTIPVNFFLSQNYPNPFNPSTTIRYSLPSSANVKLSVYDLLGREIATLVNEEQSAGWKEVQWNAGRVSSGIYFYKLTTGSFVEVKKMMVLK
jgi:S-formylglutathione hydrolase FrmB